jgi:hypothetical protein
VTVSNAPVVGPLLSVATLLRVVVALTVALTVAGAVEVVATATLEMMTATLHVVMIADLGVVMTAVAIVIAVMIDATSVAMGVVAVTAPPLPMLILSVKFARSMVTPPRIVGGATLMTRKTREKKEIRVHILHPMEWTQTGILIQVPLIISPVN